MNAMKTEQVSQFRRAALAAGVGTVLVGGVLLFVPDGGRGARPPGPEERALTAVRAGVAAAPTDLNALIEDREKRLRAHPGDGAAWAVLGAAYVERGVRRADPASYPKADLALRHALDERAAKSAGSVRSAKSPGHPGHAGGPGGHGGHGGSSGRGDDGKQGARGGGSERSAPARIETLVGLASLANARNDFAAAKKWGETARERRPGAWAAYPVLIDAYSGLGDYEAAGKALDRLKQLRPDAPAVLTRAAAVYRDRGWREDAAAKVSEAVARAGSPAEKAEGLYALGELAWERGEPAEAVAHYNAALAAARDHPASLAGRARALAALGRADEAYGDYQTALEKLPRPEYALELGELYASKGLDGDARTQYDTLRRKTARAQEHGVNEDLVLARFESDHGNPRTAVARLMSEWDRHHRSTEVADALGWALYRAGRGTEALKYARRATDQGRRSALFSYHRGEIERSLEKYGPARRHIEEALRINPYFSPLLAPRARDTLAALGEPAPSPAPSA
jgi:tetratricopeptide (TPR) repeat protein